MTEQQKKEIYTLLRTAAQSVYGYTPEKFESPEFVQENKTLPDNSSSLTNASAQAVPTSFVSATIPVEKTASYASAQVPSQETVLTPSSGIQTSTPVTSQDTKPSSSPLSMGDIIFKVARCTRCSLARTRMNTVPGIGVKNPEVMVIGEAPSIDENATGLPLTGPAGQLLEKMLVAIKLKRDLNCYMTNIVKCMPPQNRGPSPEETAACSGYLEAQIKVLKPKMILCTGRMAVLSLLRNNTEVNLSQNIDMLHGKWFDYNGIPVFVIHNPQEVLRNTSLKKPVWDDLRAFAARLQETSASYKELYNS